MSDIVLSAAVRQNLLSLQSTTQLLATTQNNLATGNKVNSALDNPTNYFTAQSLNNRASDINNLLDSVGNGVQVLQAANDGITSLQSLLDSAKSVANQALQTATGYSTKSTATSLAITGATADNLLGTPDTAATVTGTAVTTPSALTDTETLATAGFANGNSFTLNGKTISFVTGTGASDAEFTTDGSGNIAISLASTTGNGGKISAVEDAIKQVLGGTSTASVGTAAPNTNKLTITAGDTSTSINLQDGSGGALAKLGLVSGTTGPTSSKDGQTLTIKSVDGGQAVNLKFGTKAGEISTLDDLNTALASDNLEASIDSSGKLSITTTNDHASTDLSKISSLFGGTSIGNGGLLTTATSLTASAPVADADAQNTRAGLVKQYNTIIDQITTTAQDASLNGINLLNGDQLSLVFNETGTSKLNVSGFTDNPAGLGLSTLTAGTDFLDNNSTNKVLDQLTKASNQLRQQASTLGSNLSIVQIRQTFSQNMINTLQTAASNLTLADPNTEAANSQALSTRQSIAVSALALANQSQQSVLRLLQ